MKITIIGASAGIGLHTVLKALEKGHAVTALSRNIADLPEHPLLRKLQGSATSLTDVKKALADSQAVIVTVGTKNKKPNTLFSDTARTLLTAVAELQADPVLLVVTGFGAGESSNHLSFFMRTIIRLFLKHQYRDKTLMEKMITSGTARWEIIRPGMLVNKSTAKKYRVLTRLDKDMKVGKIARTDVADFLVAQAESPSLLGQCPALTY